MIRITGRRSRILLRHVLDVVEHVVLLGLGLFVLLRLGDSHPYYGIWSTVKLAAIAGGVGTALGIALGTRPLDPPEIAWNQDGLTFQLAGEETHVPWSEYAGYRYAWEYPVKLKIRRSGKRPINVKFFSFTVDDRRLLLAELEARALALPNKRLKLAAAR